MEAEATLCPGCGQRMARVAEHGIRYSCPGCSGRLLGLRPFEDSLEDGLGARVWVNSADGATGGTCPFCGNPMHHPGPDTGIPDGIAVCHTCQQVWIGASCSEWMCSHAARGATANPAPGTAELPATCSNCGAPIEPDNMGRCRYCHAQVAAPAPIVVNIEQAPDTGTGFLVALNRFLNDPV